jgi:predicted RNA-binding Zn-ribbon protein involved in translation (DUF1610 family)
MTCQNCGSTKKPFITGLGEDIEAATCPDCGAYDIIMITKLRRENHE